MYKDPQQTAVAHPGEIPAALLDFARQALEKALAEPLALERALGETLSDPKPGVWFEPADDFGLIENVRLNQRTRMLYDAQHIFINGESYRAGGKDATLMRRLANQRYLSSKDIQRASDEALELLSIWCDDGWAHACADDTTAPWLPATCLCPAPLACPRGGLLGARLFSKWCATPSPLLHARAGPKF